MKEDARDEGFVRKVIEALPDLTPSPHHDICWSYHGIALDIGANHGIYTDLLAGKFAEVYAFEPDPNNMKILEQRVQNKLNNVIFRNEAIGVKDGEMVKLYRSDDPGGSSTNEESPRFGGWGHRWDNYIWVPTMTLDMLWEECLMTPRRLHPSFRGIRFIKCDVEGAEDYIFEYGQEMLKQNKMQIVLECHQPVNFVRLYDLFHACGYQVFDTEGNRVRALRRDAHFLVRNDL